MGFYREEADSISLDIQQFVKEEVEYLFSKVPRMDYVLFLALIFISGLRGLGCGLSLFCCGCQSLTVLFISVAIMMQYLLYCR